MDVDLLTKNDVLLEVCDALQLQHNEAAFTLYAEIRGDVSIHDGDSLGFYDIDNRYRIFEIITRTLRQPDNVWVLDCVDKGAFELMGEPIVERRARNTNVNDFVGRLLENTRFDLVTTASGTGTMSAYYESVWSALVKVQDAFGVRCVPYYTITNGLITGRHVKVEPATTVNRGRIFELGDDLTGIDITYDDSNIKTALYGRGQGVQIDGGDSSEDPAYGRRLTFADVVWSTADGDPVDKPNGQEWVGDPAALAVFGRNGRHRYGFAVFDNTTDPEVLLQQTWQKLQEQKEPVISITGTVRDTERILGRSHEAVRMYDTILIRLRRNDAYLDISAIISEIIRDYVYPDNTRITIGNALISSGDVVRDLTAKVASFEDRAAVWDRANAFDLQGTMDVMNNMIKSTVGHWYTDPDTGAIMMVSSDGNLAMRLNGAGWQIANTKVGDAWQWRTAATGSGIVADEITAGTLAAARIAAGSITLSKMVSSTSAGDGIVKLSDTGMEVSHTIANLAYKTSIKADGLRILDANNSFIGGVYVPTGQYNVRLGSSSLCNPAYPNFTVQLDRFWSGESMTWFYGLVLYRENTKVCGLCVEDDDDVSSGMLYNYNDEGITIGRIIDVAKAWSDYDPSQFIMDGSEDTGGTPRLIYAYGNLTVSSSQARSVDYSGYNFISAPTVVAQYSQTGGNISGDVGALKIYNKSTTGFNAIIGGSTSQPDRDVDWIAIGLGYGQSSQSND